jgi:hypothetical protein
MKNTNKPQRRNNFQKQSKPLSKNQNKKPKINSSNWARKIKSKPFFMQKNISYCIMRV